MIGRRDFLAQSLTALGVAGLGWPLLSLSRTGKFGPWGKGLPSIRNIVLLIGDDHSMRVMGTYGNKRIQTPNLDRLAWEGVRFTNVFCQSPVCSASRQSFLTGTYPHRTSVNLLFTSFSAEKNYTIAEHLQARGYRTAAIGKMHTNNGQPHGFQLRKDSAEYARWLKRSDGSAKGGPRPVPAHIPVRDMSKTKGFSVEQWVNPGVRPEPIYDADSLDTYLANEAVQFINDDPSKPFLLFVGFHAPHAPMNFPVEFAGRYKAEDMPLGPSGPEDLPWTPAIFNGLTDTQKREIVAGYYTCVEYLDKNVGLVLDALDASGKRDETLVVYISDHGLVDNMAMLRTTDWKYVFSTNQYDLGLGYAIGDSRPTGYVQRLYNLRRDPNELHNLAGDPAHQLRLQKLRAKLIAVFKQTHPDAAKLPANLTPEQELAWFCEPRDEVSETEKRIFPHPQRYEKKSL